jgi:LysM repeat protein
MASKRRRAIEGVMPKKNGKTKDYTSRDTPEVTKTLEDMRKPPSQRSKDATGTSRKKKPVVATKTNGKPVVTPPPKAKLPIGAIAGATALTGTTAGIIGTTAYLQSKRKKSHKVTGGQNLSSIAKKYNTTIKALMKANPSIENANMIRVGQKIKLPFFGHGKDPYKGMSKSAMLKLHKETQANKAANRKKRLAKKGPPPIKQPARLKKQAGGRLGRMGGAGLSPAEMARAGVMSEAKRRRYAKKGGTVNRKGGGQIGVGSAYVQLQYDN